MNIGPKLYMMVGLPGVGKSTWISNKIKNGTNATIIDTDSITMAMCIKAGLTYSEGFSKYYKDAEKQMYRKLMAATKKNENIIWDQTNLTINSRKKKLILIPDHYEKFAVVFPKLNETEHKRRLATRPDKVIPWHVVEAMQSTYQAPTTHEGFDSIIEVS